MKAPTADGPPPLLNDMPEVMCIDEVAAVLRVHPDTVRAWIRRGRLTCFRQGRTTRVTRAQLSRFLEGGTA